MHRQMVPESDVAAKGQSAEDEAINAQLVGYIRNNTFKIPSKPVRMTRRERLSLILIPFLYAIGAVVFLLAVSVSLISGLVERRFSFKLWERLGFPVD
ncbi:MAG: hypothetical protein JWM58_3658 [Rhizobium sp.]|nr:hypothetical protein [Rhizobium sp.]